VGNLDDKAAPGLDQDAMNKKADADLEAKKEQTAFSFNENAKEIDTSFFNNLVAVLLQRFNNYKRNKYAIFNDAILPAILLTLGVGLSQIEGDWFN